jgi:hypothetical protein
MSYHNAIALLLLIVVLSIAPSAAATTAAPTPPPASRSPVAPGEQCALRTPPMQPQAWAGGRSVTVTATCVNDKLMTLYYAARTALYAAEYADAISNRHRVADPEAELIAGNVHFAPRARDGNMTTARFHSIRALVTFVHKAAFFSSLYMMDGLLLRKLSLAAGVVTTVAGGNRPGFSNGVSWQASFLLGEAYLAVANAMGDQVLVSQPGANCVRIVHIATSTVSTLIGVCGSFGAHTSGKMAYPGPLFVDFDRRINDDTRLFVADYGIGVVLSVKFSAAGGKGHALEQYADAGGLSLVSMTATRGGDLVAAANGRPCEMFYRDDGTDTMVRVGTPNTPVPPACALGQPSFLAQYVGNDFILVHRGANITMPVWAVASCPLPKHTDDGHGGNGGDDDLLSSEAAVTGIIVLAVVLVGIIVAVAVVVNCHLRRQERDDGLPPPPRIMTLQKDVDAIHLEIAPDQVSTGSSFVAPAARSCSGGSIRGSSRGSLLGEGSVNSRKLSVNDIGVNWAPTSRASVSGIHDILVTVPPTDDDTSLKPSVREASLLMGSEMIIAAVSAGDFDPLARPTDVAAEMHRHNERCLAVSTGNYHTGKVMGRGAHGCVYSVMLTDGSTIAMKEVGLVGSHDEIMKQTADVDREMKMLSTLRHRNIVMYYGAVADSANVSIKLFMEMVTGGSLGSLVRSIEKQLNEQPARRFVLQILEGLSYMHERGFVHRDLKSDNVLIDQASGFVKLADFGSVKRVGNATNEAHAAQTVIGTPLFMAPEVMLPMMYEDEEVLCCDKFGYGKKADVWSLGIMVAELLDKGRVPWPNFSTPGHAFTHICSSQSSPVIPGGISDEAAGFIKRCTQRDPSLRPNTRELMLDPWLL